MKAEKIIKYAVLILIVLVLLNYVIFPGLAHSNSLTQFTSLLAFIFIVFWIFGVKIRIKK